MPTNIFSIDIEKETLNNTNFRKVIHTTNNQQLVVMSLKPGEHIPLENHPNVDQFIRIEKGSVEAVINKTQRISLPKNSVIMIPSNTWHEIINVSSKEDAKIYTIYSPPEHPEGTIDIIQPAKSQKGGQSEYYDKYLKYKNKYLSAKFISKNK